MSETWLTGLEYPASARTVRAAGVSTVVWAIDSSGKVGECRAVVSAGMAALDAAACHVIRRNARYRQPALDRLGKPVASWGVRSIDWRAPDLLNQGYLTF